ncbi:hypothetical protein LCGC14_2365360, partial [marine sediment metagenome]
MRDGAKYSGAAHQLTTLALTVLAALLLAAPATALAAEGEFSPTREFPDTWDRIGVFADQLPSLSVAQRKFAASHYAGTQKQTSNLIDAIRVYNPDFLMLQYRLGTRESGHSASYIHNNSWSNDWAYIDSNPDWFIGHWGTNPDPRVYQFYAGWLKEYCMDVSGNISGNTTNGWKEYFSTTVINDINASHGDGVFADSTHLPYAVPADQYASPLGSPPHTALIPHLEIFYDYVYQQYTAANMYFIPNIGSLVTTIDTTSGYYEDVHGAMIEGFAVTRYGFTDWRMQANRTLRLVNNDKILIAQNGVSSASDVAGRMWYLTNYMLVKRERSFVNILGAGTQMHWWPEYDIDLGAPAST